MKIKYVDGSYEESKNEMRYFYDGMTETPFAKMWVDSHDDTHCEKWVRETENQEEKTMAETMFDSFQKDYLLEKDSKGNWEKETTFYRDGDRKVVWTNDVSESFEIYDQKGKLRYSRKEYCDGTIEENVLGE